MAAAALEKKNKGKHLMACVCSDPEITTSKLYTGHHFQEEQVSGRASFTFSEQDRDRNPSLGHRDPRMRGTDHAAAAAPSFSPPAPVLAQD